VGAPAGSCGGDGGCRPRRALFRSSGATTAARDVRRAPVGLEDGAGVVVW
jgi:hypothetical protein